jgi:hypothetical protein
VENGNRIGSLSITPTVARQTPQNDFGTVFARTAQEVVRTVGGGGGRVGRGGTGGTSGQGDQWDLLAAQKEMQADGMKMNLAYMNLQNDMQKESRAHNALSNIMKVRHDSAKAAINNIR